ncbi:hypothetical protein [Mesorhizobium sp. M0136]
MSSEFRFLFFVDLPRLIVMQISFGLSYSVSADRSMRFPVTGR